MSNVKDFRSAVAAHLEFYGELGVTGVSRDRAWRTRQTVPVDASAEPAAPAASPTETPMPPQAPIATSADPLAPGEGFGIATADTDAPPRAAADLLVELREHIGDCTRCKLHKLGRTQVVFGVGNPRAQLMFVGEAPGSDEDIQGVPFVGRAGQLLTKIIEAIGLTRDEVYIANVIKCRPPQNRNPEPDEVATCEPFLFRQIDAIKPRVIVALGTFAAQCLLKSAEPISRMRGRVFSYRGAQLIPTFHPAFLLRSPERKRDVWDDMKKVRTLLNGEEA
jgi:uracil-DNA glycosylase family 4